MVNRAGLFLTFVPKLRGNAPARHQTTAFWSRIREAIFEARRHHHATSRDPALRGAAVATDSLITLYLKHLSVGKWTVFSHPSFKQPIASILGSELLPHSLVETMSIPSLASDLLPHIDLWLDPGGATPVSVLFRQWFGQTAYPIIAVQHTMSLHNLLQDYFLPIINTQTYPWDCLVCSTNSSARAVSSLFDRAALYSSDEHCKFRNVSGFSGRIDVIPLPVDTDYFSPGNQDQSRRLLGLDKKQFLILYLGAISATKGDLAPFLPSFKALVEQYQAVSLKWIIAGPADPRYLTYLQLQVKSMNLDQNVIFLDYVSESKKLNLYRAADVFFSPADGLQESFGLTVVEAMACGLPQVVSDWDGYRETVVNGTTGFRIKTLWGSCDSELKTSGFVLGSDHDHIATGQSVAIDLRNWNMAIGNLLQDPELRKRMGSASRNRALSLYSYSAVASQYQDLLEELCTLHQSCRVEFARKQVGPYTANYFQAFSHYASSIVKEGTRLKPVSITQPLSYLQNAANFINGETQLISLDTCWEIMEELKAESGGIGSCLSFDTARDPRRLRHILWLMKHGYVEGYADGL